MTFFEAKKWLSYIQDASVTNFVFGMSGNSNQLEFYLRAYAAKNRLSAEIKTLPYATLGQHLSSEPTMPEVYLILPWDLVPECDWRVGFNGNLFDLDMAVENANKIATLLANRPETSWAYLHAPIPPLSATFQDNLKLSLELASISLRNGATYIPPDRFSLASYLSSGSPVNGTQLSPVAEILIHRILGLPENHFKILATDADDTLWAGLIGEDGIDFISAESHGRGSKHFIYQNFLLRLKEAGILLAVISRNDVATLHTALKSERMVLNHKDFVAILGGYGAKSDNLRSLVKSLNLNTDSIVFVDDNPVELAEVASSLEGIRCEKFPHKDDDLPAFLDRLTKLFNRRTITLEDRERTELYRRRLTLPAYFSNAGQTLEGFLAGLRMVLTIHDRSDGNWVRAHQLINKTNQFNLNGRRMEEKEIIEILKNGGRLFTASLEDQAGNHGEILACLIDQNSQVQAFVMSCRVFQRRIEFAFTFWLLEHWVAPSLKFVYARTLKNEPFVNFLSDNAFSNHGNYYKINREHFIQNHTSDYHLFSVRTNF